MHDWEELDPEHKQCRTCGLRLFLTSGQWRTWVTLDHNGVPNPPMFNSQGDRCVPPPAPPIADVVYIQYTGHPDQYPGCERIMHRVAGGGTPGLVDLAQVRPVCGARCAWWEIGPARDHAGWTWCVECWRSIGAAQKPLARQLEQKESEEKWLKKPKKPRKKKTKTISGETPSQSKTGPRKTSKSY